MLKSSSGIRKATVIPVPNPIDTRKLMDAAEKLRFRDCKVSEGESWGFITPDYTDNWPLVPMIQHSLLFTLRRDRRVPNKRRLSREWNEAIREKEKAEDRKLTKEERAELRKTCETKLIAQTPPQESEFQAIYDGERRLLVVLESTGSRVQFVVEKFNRLIDPQGVSVEWEASRQEAILEGTLTAWAYRPELIPEDLRFTLGTDYRLTSADSTAVLANHSPGEEINIHLMNQKLVEKVELYWGETVSFCLSAKKVISQIDFKSYCSESIKSVRENENIDDIRVYQEGLFLVFYDAFLELWDAVCKIPETPSGGL
ncbi:recombination-associated protein RdgC [Marinimicrobium sp. ABcell2]|uniref:recombination-associated protein RdgC n=1 Tax=Marinimicrobium sp. ABcell2 TaxID=3069751 RepID=UPI0027ADB28B|nr:recombination-associated protein RdgC [Marinimicrobium sp. ABcell2]MDQ2077406.1 recombination-associated protein RdgC [Marinimicrobium sp. ABcell2]